MSAMNENLEPKLEDYHVEPFLYRNYQDDLYVFLKYKIGLTRELGRNRWFWPSLLAVLALSGVSLYFLGEYWFLGALAAYFAVYYLGIFKSNHQRAIEAEIRDLDRSLGKYEQSMKAQVAPYEKALAGYWQKKLEDFFRAGIFRKPREARTADEFWRMLEEAKEIDNMLVSERIHVGRYERYFASRRIPHSGDRGEPTSDLLRAVAHIRATIEERKHSTAYPESFNIKK